MSVAKLLVLLERRVELCEQDLGSRQGFERRAGCGTVFIGSRARPTFDGAFAACILLHRALGVRSDCLARHLARSSAFHFSSTVDSIRLARPASVTAVDACLLVSPTRSSSNPTSQLRRSSSTSGARGS